MTFAWHDGVIPTPGTWAMSGDVCDCHTGALSISGWGRGCCPLPHSAQEGRPQGVIRPPMSASPRGQTLR